MNIYMWYLSILHSKHSELKVGIRQRGGEGSN